MPKIIFTKVKDFFISPEYYPAPSKKYLPDWYKNIDGYLSDKPKGLVEGLPAATIKKCLPVFDVLTSGYIIPTFSDLHIEKQEGVTTISTPNSTSTIDWHGNKQFTNHPFSMQTEGAPKFMSPWSIKTPKGYSCLFINPVHGSNPYFTIFEGIVDTDEYRNPVNFPFTLKYENFEGLIPAGTPVVQVIPFKREKWKMKEGGKVEILEAWQSHGKLKSVFYEAYKKLFWSSKSFE
jgi:hypothetical protein